jgi:hypothetical protein
MLDQVLYGQRSIFSLDANEQNRARITADLRTNSLVVVGPVAEQRKVQALIEELDKGPPETAVQPTPEIIQIHYGDATEIANVIKEVFAMQVYQPNQQNQGGQGGGFGGGGFNPFGGGFGGFGGGGRGRAGGADRSRITIGVDQQNNQIIVSAPRVRFEEIERLAKTLDEASKDNQKTAQVVTLRNAKPDAVRKALKTALGVKTSEDATRRGGDREGREGDRDGRNNQQGPRFNNFGGPNGPNGPRGPGGFDGGGRRGRVIFP